jgi:hypothetical protein
LFTAAGITTHATHPASVTKVRFGTDFERICKMLNKDDKIEDRKLGIFLKAIDVRIIRLPEPMVKLDALRYLLTAPEFQSPADQELIADTLADRQPRAKRVPRVKPTKAQPQALSARAATVTDILAAITKSTAEEA